MDPRQAGKNKLAEHKQYKTVPKFSSLATTQSGDVAVGADDGQIRLYNSISKVAKVSGEQMPELTCAVSGSGTGCPTHGHLTHSYCMFCLWFSPALMNTDVSAGTGR